MNVPRKTIFLAVCAALLSQAGANFAAAEETALPSSSITTSLDVDPSADAAQSVQRGPRDDADDTKAFSVVSPLPIKLPPLVPSSYFLPGQFAFRTKLGYYLTAVSGGGRSADPTVVTAATTAGSWEQFRISVANPATSYDKSFLTATGNYVTAVNGGGMTSNALHTDATHVSSWEQFRMLDLSSGGFAPTYYAIQTIGGKEITAAGNGGHYSADAIHTDATSIGSWEELRPVKCGDLGSGYSYFIVAADGSILTASDGGGRIDEDAFVPGTWFGEPVDLPWSKFKLMRQADGSYGLQTSSGFNYVTALGGGGLVQEYEKCDPGWFGACIDGFSTIFHTDATQVRGWEKFTLEDQGNCKYAIKTSSGFYFGQYKDSHGYTLFTTRRSVLSPNEMFEFVPSDLASPPIFR